MKTIATFLVSIILVMGAYGQEEEKQLSKSELRRLQREAKKAQADEEREKASALTKLMVENQKYVLEAEFLSDRTGSRVPVQAMINFILVDSLAATVQFGSAMSAGYNGVGGATVDGRITSYKYQATGRKKDAYSVMINFMSSLGTYDITLMVSPNGSADATIRGNWSGSLNYHGRLVPLPMSRIYKGTPTY
jgi:hypothetical protein